MNEFEKLYSNEGIYGVLSYGCPIVCKGLKCAVHLSQFGELKGKKILCVGSGNAYEAVWFIKQGYDVTILEIYHPDMKILKGKQVKGYAQDMPFKDKEFDLYFCCETMEHVPEELNTPILKEAKRISKEVFFTIADRDDPPYHTHINIHNFCYWFDLFKELGFDIINAQFAASLPMLVREKNSVVLAGWSDGTVIHASC